MLNIKYGVDKDSDLEHLREKMTLRALNGAIKKKYGYKSKFISYNDYLFIFDNYHKMPLEEIAQKVKKSPYTVKQIATNIGINCVYLDNDEMILNQLIKILCKDNLDGYQLLHFTRHGAPIYQKGNWKVTNVPKFLEWFRDHRKLINLHNYEYHSLGKYEPSWLIRKAFIDKEAYPYINKRPWTDDDDAWLELLVKKQATYKECSEKLKRTGAAIKRRCYDLKLPKPRRLPPKLWSRYELNKLKFLWHMDYEPILIAKNLRKRSDRMVIAMLERFKYFGYPPEKFCIGVNNGKND